MMRLTAVAVQEPPREVLMPRLVSSAAIARSLAAEALNSATVGWISFAMSAALDGIDAFALVNDGTATPAAIGRPSQ